MGRPCRENLYKNVLMTITGYYLELHEFENKKNSSIPE
jgi:hypothetical protein